MSAVAPKPIVYIIIFLLFSSLLTTTHSNIINAVANEYKDSTITCIDNEDCYINCSGENACKNTEILCPNNHQCGVTCNADNSCQDSLIMATQSSLFILTCKGGNDFTCSGLSIYFPPNADGIPFGVVQLDDQNKLNSLSKPLQFYAINGWNDIDISSHSRSISHQGTMHCSSTYDIECEFAISAWRCADIHHSCNNYTQSMAAKDEQRLNSFVFNVKFSIHTFFLFLMYIVENENFVQSISDLDSLWYIIGAIILFLCLFLCLLLCLIRRSYHLHVATAKGLKSATNELNVFKSRPIEFEANDFFITSPKYHNNKHSIMNTNGTLVFHHNNMPHSFSTMSGIQTPIPLKTSNLPSSLKSAHSANTNNNSSDIEVMTHPKNSFDTLDDDTLDDQKYGVTTKQKKKNKKKPKKSKKTKIKTKKTKKGKYKLSIDEWDPSQHQMNEMNNKQSPQTPIHPPSIVSISRSTTLNANAHNNMRAAKQLSLQHQQLNRLHAHSIGHKQNKYSHRAKSPSMYTQTTVTSMNTVNTVQSMNTFKRMESVKHEDEDEFLSYHHQTPSNGIFNKSRMSHTMSDITQITPHHGYQPSKRRIGGASGAMSSTMPLSVNSPSHSAMDSDVTDTLSNTTDMSSIQLQTKYGADDMGHIPQFVGDSPIMAPLHETETSECEKLRHVPLKTRRKGRDRDTISSDPFASTVVTGVTTVTSATSGMGSSNSYSTSCSSSIDGDAVHDKHQHGHHHHHHHCCDDEGVDEEEDDDESEEMLRKGLNAKVSDDDINDVEVDEDKVHQHQHQHHQHGFVSGIQGMLNSGFNRIRDMVNYNDEDEEGGDDDHVVEHGVVDENDTKSKVKTDKL